MHIQVPVELRYPATGLRTDTRIGLVAGAGSWVNFVERLHGNE